MYSPVQKRIFDFDQKPQNSVETMYNLVQKFKNGLN